MSDVMLFGVLRMPYEMAMSSELSRRQFWDRAQELADRAERVEAAQPTLYWCPACHGFRPSLPEPAEGSCVECSNHLMDFWRAEAAQPVAWIRRHPDGSLTKEVLLDSAIEDVRKTCGAWVPLYAAPVGEAAQRVPDGWAIEHGVGGFNDTRWVCVRNLQSQLGQDFYEDRDPLIFGFLAALAGEQP